jgi:imidazolonepropionase-like amidohydrolase
LSPAQAIQLATYQAAKISGTLNDRGSIEEGKLADLIMVKGQPTQSIEDLRKITLVLTRGYAIIPNEIYSLIHVKPFVASLPLSLQ